jgi:pyrophosphate--fructose-6-phosphate 1-phosphotransferase
MLSSLRQQYHPVVSPLLKDLKNVTFEKKQILSVKPEIQKLFPEISSLPLLQAKKGSAQNFPALKIGAVFSGGQASGGHNVLTGLFDALQALNSSSQLIGFLGGPSGIIGNKTVELTAQKLDPYRNQGGFDLLGSGRVKIETDEQLQSTLKTVQALNLDGLLVIGGDDSNTNAAIIAAYFLKTECKIKVIGVPKTIDGDLQNAQVEIPFGFDTATKIYSELIGNIGRDVLSSKKYYHFIKLMGRSASHITLECALKTHPNLTLISEERQPLAEITQRICDLIQERSAQQKNYGIILIPEGLIEYMPEMAELMKELGNGKLSLTSKAFWDLLPERVQQQLLLEKDPHGNINLSAIETEVLLIDVVTRELAHRNFREKFNGLSHFFGYEGRAGLPSNFDANYCYALGQAAALLIAHGFTSYMAFVDNLTHPASEWGIGGLPLASLMVMKSKPVIAKTYVDLRGKAYQRLLDQAPQWALGDDYQCPGPIQFFGESMLTESIPLIL